MNKRYGITDICKEMNDLLIYKYIYIHTKKSIYMLGLCLGLPPPNSINLSNNAKASLEG